MKKGVVMDGAFLPLFHVLASFISA